MAKDSLLDISAILTAYADSVKQDIEEICEEVTSEGVKRLKNTKNTYTVRSGEYNKSWSKKITKGYNFVNGKIYNKDHYRLTHLLEDGHDIKRDGTKVGETRSFKHIEPVDEYVSKKFEDGIVEAIKKGGR